LGSIASGDNLSLVLENNLDTIPWFVDPTPGIGIQYDATQADWSLSVFSPMINKGSLYPGGIPLPEFDFLGNNRVNGISVDLGAIENQAEQIEITRHPDNLFLCLGDTATFTVETNDSAHFQWLKDGLALAGDTSSTLIIDSVEYNDQGNYSCKVSNGYGTLVSNPSYLLVNLPPRIQSQPADQWVTPGEQIILKTNTTGTEPMFYQWKKNGIEIPGGQYPELFLTPADSSDEGLYSFTVYNACGEAETTPSNLWLAPQICMVTVSQATGHNLVVWEKRSTVPILNYNVYRESVAAGIYDLLLSQPYDDLSVFVDTTADPTVQAYLYKITANDTTEVETDIDLCQPHKTIHLIVSTNPELNTTQLQWDRYYGFDYQTYTIYKSNTGINFDPVHNLSASLNSWTDPEPSNEDQFYRIAVEKPIPCEPEGTGKKAGTGPYRHSLSNMDNNKLKAGELPPDTITLSNNSIEEEKSPATVIGKLITADEDSIDAHTYQFVPGEGDEDNISFTLMGDLLLASESFDYEIKSEYRIRIRSTDQAGNYCEVPFIILIIDVDEATGLPELNAGAVEAFPNPFSQSTTITFPDPSGESYRMILMDISGKLVRMQENITTEEFILKRKDLSKGMYIIELKGKKTYRGKLVIE